MATAAESTEREHGPDGLTVPSTAGILIAGLPGFIREGVLPLGAFYAGWKLSGLDAGIIASAAVAAIVYAYERRAGRDGLLIRFSLAFIAVQTLVGLLSHNTTAYLATPVLGNALWGTVFLASVALQRPLAGSLACAWYPFPKDFRQTAAFKRVFRIESIVWGSYLLARSALQLTVLLHVGVNGYFVVAVLTGAPTTFALLAWSVWYATSKFGD